MRFFRELELDDMPQLSEHWLEFASALRLGKRAYRGHFGVESLEVEDETGRLRLTKPPVGEPRLEEYRLLAELLKIKTLEGRMLPDQRHNLILYGRLGSLAAKQIHRKETRAGGATRRRMDAIQVAFSAVHTVLFEAYQTMPKTYPRERYAKNELVKAAVVLGRIPPRNR